MICKNCGAEVADYAAFCTSCGSAINTQPEPQAAPQAEPQYQAPVTAQPVYQPSTTNYILDFNTAVKQYIEIAASVLVPSIIGLALSAAIPLIGQIIGLIMAGNTSSKLGDLPFVDEATLDPATLSDYQAARRKAKTAGILTKINKIYSGVMLAFWICYIIFWIIWGILMAGLSMM